MATQRLHNANTTHTTRLRDKIAARITASHEIVHALALAANTTFGDDRDVVTVLARRIEVCAAPSNHYIARNLPSRLTNHTYDTIGTFWRCNSKLCPSCLAKHAQRNRSKLRHAINAQTLERGERLTFATFTITNPATSITTTREIVNRAWTLFRKRKLCVSLIRGGCKAEEFTLTARGYHYHLHCIFRSRWLQYQEVRRVWTECVELAFEEQGLPLKVATKDGLLFVKLQPITGREASIREICKYVTKSDSWRKLKANDLIAIALIRRWHRMFELFGSFAASQTQNVQAEDPAATPQAIVHTKDLSDGKRRHISVNWRQRLAVSDLETFLEVMETEWRLARDGLAEALRAKFPTATFITAEELGLR